MSSLIEFMYQIQWFLYAGTAVLVLWVTIVKIIERIRANKINDSYDRQYGKGKYQIKGTPIRYESLQQLSNERNIKLVTTKVKHN